MARIKLKSVTFRVPFQVPGHGMFETLADDIAERAAELYRDPKERTVVIIPRNQDNPDHILELVVPFENVVKCEVRIPREPGPETESEKPPTKK